MAAKLPLFILLAQALSSIAQLDVGTFYYACYPSSPSADTTPAVCPALPVTIVDSFFLPTCLCVDITNTTGNPSVFCSSFDKPTTTPPTFDDLCGGSRLAIGNTCADIDAINDISKRACTRIEDTSTALTVFCLGRVPDPKVQTFLNKYPIGKVVLNLLDIACAAKPTLMDVNILCRGVSALATGCDVANGGSGSGSSNSSASVSSATSSASSSSTSSPSPSSLPSTSRTTHTYSDPRYYTIVLPIFVAFFTTTLYQLA